MTRPLRNAAIALLGLYLAVMLYLTLLFWPGDHPPPNLIPFRSMASDFRHGGRDLIVNFVGNIVALIPLGILIPSARRGPTRAWHVAMVAMLFSGGIEVTQYASGRRTGDVDDVILNTLGALLGYAILRGSGRLLTSLASRSPRP
jgi:glycopeptide antibiotics resistance protein